MMDDDTRMHSGRGGCFCPLHMKEFNRRIRKKYSPAQLKEALLKDDALAEVWDKFQQEGLFEMVRRIRAEFDAVDPSIQGMFCTCNGDIRHAPAMAEILAAKGAPPVLRINNPEYLYMHEKPNEVIAWMQKTAVQKAHAPEECTILVETDTCCHNRCFTSAATIHALYTWSLLNGCPAESSGSPIPRSILPRQGRPIGKSSRNIPVFTMLFTRWSRSGRVWFRR